MMKQAEGGKGMADDGLGETQLEGAALEQGGFKIAGQLWTGSAKEDLEPLGLDGRVQSGGRGQGSRDHDAGPGALVAVALSPRLDAPGTGKKLELTVIGGRSTKIPSTRGFSFVAFDSSGPT